MQQNIATERLHLTLLSLTDVDFIFELLNTPEWKKFIGDRNIQTSNDAKTYIQKICDAVNMQYWTVKLKESHIPIGIITVIQRDYLEHPDIGFAFLPRYAKKGYAYEATSAVLNELIKNSAHPYIFATTVSDNFNSIRLLEKLGLQFSKLIAVEEEKLLVYAVKTSTVQKR